MTRIGVDLEQYLIDPQSSGIQRVLQHLARQWPEDLAQADFVLPLDDRYLLLSPAEADAFVSLAFQAQDGTELRALVGDFVERFAADQRSTALDETELIARCDAWLLPEVSYLPSVLQRFENITQSIPGAMIGYDILPMSEPANYRLIPGTDGYASEYFRLLATAGSVVCISEHTRSDICTRLRRDPHLPISVAHPGGDHVALAKRKEPQVADRPTRFLRIGTLEARKSPREIIAGFEQAIARGANAELVFIGRPSASDESINQAMHEAVDRGVGIRWIADADDHEVERWVRASDVFLSIGVEGYGIPVLEAIRLGTPVVFGGIQPAAELMIGKGAQPIEHLTVDAIAEMFATFAQPEARTLIQDSLAPDTVPTWVDFTRGVVSGVLAA
jgi:hypothetical protein